MEELLLTAADAADWAYRGEGAANLVLGYTGSSPAFVGKVLRLRKAPRRGGGEACLPVGGGALGLTDHERLLWKEVEEAAGETLTSENVGRLFALHVMAPLLGPDHVDAGMRVSVAKEFLTSIEKIVEDQRPSWRVEASKVNTSCDSAILISDHSVVPQALQNNQLCVAVEIKPKCGFLPWSEFIAEGNSAKRHASRFKMHQALKIHQGEICQLSDYDPLDLFSGSRERIHQAVRALVANPQNNLRVFLNGTLIFGVLDSNKNKSEYSTKQTCEKNRSFEESIEEVIQADYGLRLLKFQDLVAEAIFRSRILDQLLEAQMLDRYDIEGAIHAYYNIIFKPCPICNKADISEGSNKCHVLHSLTLEESMKVVKEYLISATAKDCSLMISFMPGCNGEETSGCNSVFLESTNQWFAFKASFIDLDMKPLRKMAYYYELDKKIVDFFSNLDSGDIFS